MPYPGASLMDPIDSSIIALTLTVLIYVCLQVFQAKSRA